MSPLDIARGMMKRENSPDAGNAKDAVSPAPSPEATTLTASSTSIASGVPGSSAAFAKPLTASSALSASREVGDGGPAQIIGLTTLWHRTLKHRAGCGDRAAARELAELEAYLASCDRGEVVLPAHPSDEALGEWNRLADERHRAKHRKL